ncbi:hypothetical protein SEA_SONALI_50 [Arthrobacter phage Sonali]|uniref:Uncharacterized protein n=1 Tax=Arthrobacter phage Sonali TaxID=2510495 RepID=A0A411CQQ3_9CAUD|nr:hypothetical protein HOV09_gp50 [Arthrobacter phage Sonali]QAY16162.1 hypothetical protein SEA_SONALI_50 [Arthrobacter phage Sonali]
MTDIQELTLKQAQIIAAAWHEVRPDWGIPSLMTLLQENSRHAPFAELLRAGINAGLNPKVRTPAVIFKPGKHWLDAEAAQDPARTSWFGNDSSDECPNHPTVKAWNCRPCRTADPKPANFKERVAAEAEKVRAARAAALTPATTVQEAS